MEKQIVVVKDFDVINGRLCVDTDSDEGGWIYQQCVEGSWEKKCLSSCPKFGKIQKIKDFNNATGRNEVEKRLEICGGILVREKGRRMSQEELNERVKKQKEEMHELRGLLAKQEKELAQFTAEAKANRVGTSKGKGHTP